MPVILRYKCSGCGNIEERDATTQAHPTTCAGCDSPYQLMPEAKKFPLEPLGSVVIVRKIASDISAGGVYVPTNEGQFAYIIGEVVAVGLGIYSSDGTILRPMVNVGDTVVAPLPAAKQITFEIQRHLKERGVAQEELDKLFVIPEQMLAARFV